MSLSFGQAIPVTGPGVGFAGTVSRLGERVIVARQVLSSTTNNINFGDPTVLIADSTGGTWQSVKDFVGTAANVLNIAAQFAGIAVREVKTNLTYPNSQTPGTLQTGYYAPAEMAEVLERGSVTVPITHGTPSANQPVYVRIVANSALTATSVGDLEAADDTVTTTGSTSGAATALTAGSGTGLAVGQIVTGLNIPAGTYVAAVTTTAVTLSQASTGTVSGNVVFHNCVALPNAVFRTGVLDSANMSEITLKGRNAA